MRYLLYLLFNHFLFGLTLFAAGGGMSAGAGDGGGGNGGAQGGEGAGDGRDDARHSLLSVTRTDSSG